jgi:hypothetical protein
VGERENSNSDLFRFEWCSMNSAHTLFRYKVQCATHSTNSTNTTSCNPLSASVSHRGFVSSIPVEEDGRGSRLWFRGIVNQPCTVPPLVASEEFRGVSTCPHLLTPHAHQHTVLPVKTYQLTIFGRHECLGRSRSLSQPY